MGLDMYLSGRKFMWSHDQERPQMDGFEIEEYILRLGYWRKHPNLHGYIVQTYAAGEDNCQDIDLDADALKDILDAVRTNRLPHTEGFFFGKSSSELEDIVYDVNILTAALEWLEKPDKTASKGVFYRASW